MSCILFSFASYDALAQSPAFALALETTGINRTPKQFAADLFNLNVRAFQDRYEGRYQDQIEGATVDTRLDFEFGEFDDETAPAAAMAKLKTIIRRIRYQCADANDYETSETGQQLETLVNIFETDLAQAVKDAEQTERELKEVERQMLLEMKRRERDATYTHLTRATKEKPATSKLAAANIRQELKAAFPKVKFSVRCDHNSINISWELGPTSKQVEAITSKYREGHFDGMDDSYRTDNMNVFVDVFGGARYVFPRRDVPQDVFQKLARDYCTFQKIEITGDLFNVRDKHGDYISRAIQQILSAYDVPQGAEVLGLAQTDFLGGGDFSDFYRLRLSTDPAPVKPRLRYDHATKQLIPA